MITCCPVCGGSDLHDRFTGHLPLVASIASPAALQDTLFGTMILADCAECGHLFNRGFDPDLLNLMYGSVGLTNLPVHPSMDQRLDNLLSWLPSVAGANVVEVGAGGGHFARRLAATARWVSVFEPCLGLTREMLPEPNINLIHDCFTSKQVLEPVDFFVCRHVLEHVVQPARLLQDMANALSPGGSVYVEVPCATFVLDHAAILDVHMPHVQYFSLETLIRVAAESGLHPLRVLMIKNGHDMGVLFTRDAPPSARAYPQAGAAAAALSPQAVALRHRISALPGRLALYGASMIGERLTSMSAPDRFAAAFDDSPSSIDMYLYTESSVLPIRPPTKSALSAIDSVLIATYLHDIPIAEKLRGLGFKGAIHSVRPDPIPSNDLGLMRC